MRSNSRVDQRGFFFDVWYCQAVWSVETLHSRLEELVGHGNIVLCAVGVLSFLVIGESIFGGGEGGSSHLRCRFAIPVSMKMAFSGTTKYVRGFSYPLYYEHWN